jgi:hypothetical protein
MSFHTANFDHLGKDAQAACVSFANSVADLNSKESATFSAAEVVTVVSAKNPDRYYVKYQVSVDVTGIYRGVEDSLGFVRNEPADPVARAPKPSIPKLPPVQPPTKPPVINDVGL